MKLTKKRTLRLINKKLNYKVKKKPTVKKIKLKNKILNTLMIKGKKSIAEKILKKSYKHMQKRSKKDHIALTFIAAMESSPMFLIRELVKKKKRNKTVTELPVFVKENRRFTLAFQSILASSKKNETTAGCSTYVKFQEEILNVAQNNSESLIKTDSIQESALKKKKFLKYGNFLYRRPRRRF